MASGQITLAGQLSVGAGSCVSSCGGGSTGANTRISIGASGNGCGGSGKTYERVIPPTQVTVGTNGLLGQYFDDVDILADFSAIDFLYVESSAPVLVRLGAGAARLLGVGGVFPSGYVGSDTLTLTVDGVAVSVAFSSGDQTAAQVAARINAACAIAGLPTPRATVDVSGQIAIVGVGTGPGAKVAITGGTGAAAIGFSGTPSALGLGQDIRVSGILIAEFDRNAAPSRIQLSGQASLTISAGGRA